MKMGNQFRFQVTMKYSLLAELVESKLHRWRFATLTIQIQSNLFSRTVY